MRQFIILSSCAWGEMQQRPHQMAKALARLGHKVAFIHQGGVKLDMDELPATETMLKALLQGRKLVDFGVEVYSLFNSSKHINLITEQYIMLLNHMVEGNSDTVIVSYFPRFVSVLERVRGKYRLVYDCVDDHEDMEYSYWSEPQDIELEERILEKADLILTTSTGLYLSKTYGRDNVFLSKNAVNLEDFFGEREEPEDLRNIPKPRVCYVGAVYDWFEQELFYRVIEANPDLSFVVIGPIKAGMLKKSYPNLYILGNKPHNKLHDYMSHCKVGIIPFKDNIDIIIHCDPIKLYEYVASGINVVSTALPELCINKPFVYMGQGFEAFNNLLRKSIVEDFDEKASVDFLQENTWESRAKQLNNILDGEILESYKKHYIYSKLQLDWYEYMQKCTHPILESLYGLSYREGDLDKFLYHSEKAYNLQPTNYTLRNYITALYMKNDIKTAVQVLIEDDNIKAFYKAELILYMQNEDWDLLKLKVLFPIRLFAILRKELQKLNTENKLIQGELAHYYYEIGWYDKALTMYSKLIATSACDSPLLYGNLSKILTQQGQLYTAQKLHFKMMETVDRLLGNSSRLSEWKEIFSHPNYCKNCGSQDYNLILERADGQCIVSCKNCDFAFLKLIPNSSNIHKLYNENYYGNEEIYGYRGSYYDEEKPYMFLPRLEWVSKSNIYGDDRRLLDIGCADGEFLSYAKEAGWQVCGLEISAEGYDLCKEKGIEVYNKELREIGFPDNSFHVVTLWDVLEHYISPKDELREIYRILKAGGMIFISTPNHKKGKVMGKNWFGYNASYEHLSYFEAATLTQMLMDVGFRVDTVFSHENNDWNFCKVKGIGHILLMSAVK